MTCVVALETPRSVWLGCDSFIGDDTLVDLVDRPKWFDRGRVTIAYAGVLTLPQAMESIRWPGRRKGQTLARHLVSVVDALRTAARKTDTPTKDADLLIVAEGAVYTAEELTQVVRSARGYTAIGGGQKYALGALAATEDKPPRERVERALAAAETWSPGVRRPFHIREIR